MLTTDFGMSADTLVLAYRRPLCWHVDGDNFFACRRELSFLHVDGDNLFLHVDRNNLFCMSTETILFGMSTGTIFLACRRRQSPLACRREHFCMLTETIFFACGQRQSCLACRRRQFFLHVDGDNLVLACRRGQPFWHVDSLACRRVVSRQSNFFPFSRNSAANQWRVHPCAVAMPDMYNCNC